MTFCNVHIQMLTVPSKPLHEIKVCVNNSNISRSYSVYDTKKDFDEFVPLSTVLDLDMSSAMTPHMDAEVERDRRGQREHFSPISDWLLTTGSLVCLHLKAL